MTKFYTSHQDELHHIDGIATIQKVLEAVKAQVDSPLGVISAKKDFFGNTLDPESDDILLKLQSQPCQTQIPLFEFMMSAALSAVVDVIEQQYSTYFNIELTDTLRKETDSARSHNIDSKEVMGMFSAAKQKSPNATLHFTSSKIRAQKNKVTQYLDGFSQEQREKVINFARKYSRKRRVEKKKEREQLYQELKKRAAAKRQKKTMTALKQVEEEVAKIVQAGPVTPRTILDAFPDMPADKVTEMCDLIAGKAVGRNIFHTWYNEEEDKDELYNGKIKVVVQGAAATRIMKRARKGKRVMIKKYNIAYWKKDDFMLMPQTLKLLLFLLLPTLYLTTLSSLFYL